MEISRSKTYTKIRDHRRKCNLWGKGFCLDCFGGGLIHFIQDIELEIFKEKLENT